MPSRNHQRMEEPNLEECHQIKGHLASNQTQVRDPLIAWSSKTIQEPIKTQVDLKVEVTQIIQVIMMKGIKSLRAADGIEIDIILKI